LYGHILYEPLEQFLLFFFLQTLVSRTITRKTGFSFFTPAANSLVLIFIIFIQFEILTVISVIASRVHHPNVII
jgi:hypothetical protein